RQAQDARAAFALDLLGAEAKRGNAAIDRETVAAGGAIEGRGHAEDFAPPFAERKRKAALLAELDVGQRPARDIIGFLGTFWLHRGDIAIELVSGIEREQGAADRGRRHRA